MSWSDRARRALILGVLALVLSACQVDLSFRITVDSDGGGDVLVTAFVDEQAASKVPGLRTQLRTEDLVAADWDVSEWDEDEGALEISASKDFSSPEQLQEVLDEITGPGGMFQNFRITQEAEFAERRFGLTGNVDLRRGISMFSDSELTNLLEGEMFGRPIDYYLGGNPVDEVVDVNVEVILPGEGDGASGSRASWNPQFSDPNPTVIQLQSVDENFIAQLLRWIALAGFALFALSVVLGLLAFIFEWNARRRRGVSTPGSVRSRVPGPRAAAGGAQGAAMPPQQQAMPQGGDKRVRLVCVDPLGVIYNMNGQPGDLLVSFLRSRGCNASRSTIDELHDQARLGRISTAEFWAGVGVEGAADDLDNAYIELIAPRNGAAEFLREMRRREVPVTALTNDVSSWSRRLRERDNLAMIWPWVISADVGAAKPDPGIYEALRREAGVPYEACLLIDTNADHLDTARTLGMSTAFFAVSRVSPNERPNHPIVTSFGDFFRRRA